MQVYVLVMVDSGDGICSPPMFVTTERDVVEAWEAQSTQETSWTIYEAHQLGVNDFSGADKRTKFGKWLDERGR